MMGRLFGGNLPGPYQIGHQAVVVTDLVEATSREPVDAAIANVDHGQGVVPTG